MGLCGSVPPVGADLLGAGTNYLPFQESEGGTGGRGEGELGVQESKEYKEYKEESCSVGAKSF